ncbi:MAG: response regulator [Oscillospiraceae bacterium]|nr:response regulator [Oscillospiraceae bacterium]
MNESVRIRFSDPGVRRLLRTFILLLLALVMIGLFLYMRVNVLINRYMEVQGEKQAETLAELTERQFQVELTALYTVASEITHITGDRTSALLAVDRADSDGRIGVQYIDGSPFYGKAYSIDEFPCIERAVHGENAISYCAGEGLMFAVPAMRGDNIAFVVYRLFPDEVLYQRFGVNSYSGSGRTRVEDINDNVIVTSLPPDSDEQLIFNEPSAARGIQVLETTLYTSGSAAAFRNTSIGEVMLYAAVIEDSDYHLVGYVPKEVVMQGVQRISLLVILVFLVLAAMVFFGGFLLIGLERKSRESDALREAARIAEKSNAAKSEFLSNMSHDIRTPMNAIIGFTNLAIRDPSDTERVTEYLGKIRSSSNHLLSLINDVLEMSRIESGKIELEEKPCSLPEILHDLNTIIIGQVEAKQQELTMDALNVVNEDVYCDKLRLNQVLLNLLSNAVKYTPAGGHIAVRVSQLDSGDAEHGRYEFRVKDNGIGMSPEFAARVFEAFEREKTSTVSGIQGTGLGMAITKSIVDMMGGEIRVETEKGKGSEFIVSVSFRLQSAAAPDRRIPELAGLHALVVDDDFNTCDSATTLLTQIGLRPEWTLSGKEAVLRARQAHERGDGFRVFIVDWKLPDLSGIEVARQIRAAVGEDSPILLMTAYDWPTIKDEAIEAGVNGFCNKPLFLSELYGALTKVLGSVEEQKPQAEELAPISFAGRRLLLVDDIEMNREIAVAVLEMNDFEVEEACDGTEAVEKVTAAEPGYFDAVLMDVQMPTMNGYEATRAIRTSGTPNANIPIIAMTANAFDEDKKAALEAGMDGHVAKPVDVARLMEVLGGILRNEA